MIYPDELDELSELENVLEERTDEVTQLREEIHGLKISMMDQLDAIEMNLNDVLHDVRLSKELFKDECQKSIQSAKIKSLSPKIS